MSLQHTFLVGELDIDHDGFTAVGVDHLGPPTIAVPILARIWRATFDRDTTAMLTALQAHAWSHLTAAPQPIPHPPADHLVRGVGVAVDTPGRAPQGAAGALSSPRL